MSAPRKRLQMRTASDTSDFVAAYWRGDPPPRGPIAKEDWAAVVSAYFFANEVRRWARSLGKESFAAAYIRDPYAAGHPHERAWGRLIDERHQAGWHA